MRFRIDISETPQHAPKDYKNCRARIRTTGTGVGVLANRQKKYELECLECKKYSIYEHWKI